MQSKHYLPFAIFVTVLALLASLWYSSPPKLTPGNAAKTSFSGTRAADLLEEFLREGVPHPIGSTENQRVKRRIQSWLDKQGIVHEEQRAWGCDTDGEFSCGFVENIVATIPGRESGPYVALMAHYDSVPASPGAGDDMAGVVAVLEAARAIKATGTTRKPILLIMTDGEESGLHGARAFFDQHPLAQELGVLLNVEGSGTRGESGVLRTSSANQWFMETLATSIKNPQGSSFAAEVFKRMPNDTDFSVSDSAGVPGIDFAFAAERVHYHTPLDRVGILDPRTIEHHGQNLYPLALALANGDLAQAFGPNTQHEMVFQDFFGVWLQWPANYSWLMLAVASALLLTDTLRLRGQKLLLFFAATLIPALALGAAMGAGYAASLGLEHANGITVEWPAHIWAHRLAIGSAALFASCIFAAIVYARFPAHLMLLGAWWFFAILVLLQLLLLSEAAGVYLSMLLPAALLLCLSSSLPMPETLRRLCRVATLIPAIGLITVALQTEDALGYTIVFAPLALAGLYLVLALPFFRGPWLFVLSVISAMALIVGGVAATSLPLYSNYRPQHVSVRHYEDADSRLAHWRIVTDGAVPPPIAAILDFTGAPVQLLPWYKNRMNKVAEAAYEALAPPQVEVLESKLTDDGREVLLRLASQRDAWLMGLFVPTVANLQRLQIGEVDADFDSDGEDFTPLYFFGTQNQDVVVRLVLGSQQPFQGYLMDYATQLPHAGVANARPVEATPVHYGDLSLVWQSVGF
ncbi:MAG: M20/M25/M40 family metallo-hydrolase [Congregibacter sp.]